MEDMESNEHSKQAENMLFEAFGDKYIADAIRIISTNVILPTDRFAVHEAMCIIVAMYMNKVQNKEINQDKVLH